MKQEFEDMNFSTFEDGSTGKCGIECAVPCSQKSNALGRRNTTLDSICIQSSSN